MKIVRFFILFFITLLLFSFYGNETSYAANAGYIRTGIGDADCSKAGKYCDGEGVYKVTRHTCKGYTTDACPDGLKEYGLPTISNGGRLYVDQGTHAGKCDITVQMDVSDENGLKGWMLWYSGECVPTPTNTPKPPTNTPPPDQPACGAPCDPSNANRDCDNAKNGCTRCETSTKTCQKIPTGTPVPTNTPPPDKPACNDSCATNPNICQQAGNGCTYCDPNTKTCKTPPGNTPPPVTCNSSCATNPNICQQASNGCTVCDPATKTCKTPPGNTPPPPPPPTATPTPDFDPNWCKCDGIDATDIIAGLPATFTAKGYVEAANSDKAYVKDFTFSFAKGNDVTTDRIAESNPIPAISSPGEGGRINYKADWTYTMPQNLEVGATYSIWADIKCERKTTAYNYTAQQDRGVLGAETESFWGRISNFFARLFGRGTEPVEEISTSENSSLPNASVQGDPKQINIGTFHPAEIIQKSCKIIKFKPVQ